MDVVTGFFFGAITYGIISLVLIILFGFNPITAAEFICESHELELINYEIEGTSFSKVECGNKKPELQYDDYKVFEK